MQGLKVKVPFIQDVNLIDKRVLEWDGNPTDMPTKDKLYISVDLFARWRIATSSRPRVLATTDDNARNHYRTSSLGPHVA
jgi:regulator of protease activity HflC (stomatin/prohibitin superfamily)